MTIYLVLTLCIAILSLFDSFRNNIQNKDKCFHYSVYILVLLFLIVFVGFREMGFDYDNYRYYYDRLSDFWIDNADVLRVEKGYAFLNHILPSYRVLLVVMATITLSLQLLFIYKYSPAPFASILFYIGAFLLTSTMGQYRQALAIAIVIWAFTKYNNKLIFITLITMACIFHVSALLAILVLVIPKHICQPKIYAILFVASVVVNLTAGTLFVSTIEYMPQFIAEKLNIYSLQEKGTILGFNAAMLLRLIIFLIFYYNRDVIKSYRYGELFFNLYFVSIIIYMGLGFLPQLAGRGAIYFYFMELLLAGMLVKIPRRGIVYLAFFAAISIYRQLSLFSEWSGDYIPYRNELFAIFSL